MVMPMNPAELERKVRQHDSDLIDIYGMVSSIRAVQQDHGARLDTLTAMVAGHDARFDAHDARFDSLESKLDIVLDILQAR